MLLLQPKLDVSTSATKLLKIVEDDGIFALDVIRRFKLVHLLKASGPNVKIRGICVVVVAYLHAKGKHPNVAAINSESGKDNDWCTKEQETFDSD